MNPDQRREFFLNNATKAEDLLSTQLRGAEAQTARERLAFEMNPEIQAQLEVAKAAGREGGKIQAQAAATLPAAVSTAKEAIRKVDELVGEEPVYKNGKLINADKIKPHAGFETAVGATLVPGARFVPGTSAADFMARFDEIKGGAFMQAFNTLKGGGQITEKEGEKATAAITRMSIAQSEKEFRAAAKEFQDVLRAGIKNAEKKAGKTPSGGGIIDFNDLQ